MFSTRTLENEAENCPKIERWVKCANLILYMTFRRVEKYCSSNCQNENDSNQCHYSNWSNYTPCSVTCGKGQQFSQRFLKTVRKDYEIPAFHCSSFTKLYHSPKCETLETRVVDCFKPKCQAHADTDLCQYTDWTEWGRCKPSRKTNAQIRRRFLKRAVDNSNCKRVVRQKKVC